MDESVEVLMGRCVCVHLPEGHGMARCGVEGCTCLAYIQKAQERVGVGVFGPANDDAYPRLLVFDGEENAQQTWEKLRAMGQGFQAELVTVLWIDRRVKA